MYNLENSRGHPAYRKGLRDLFSLTPFPLSVMLLGYHGNQLAIEMSCLARDWCHMTNFVLHNFSSYLWFLHVLGESRRQRRSLGSKLTFLSIYFRFLIPVIYLLGIYSKEILCNLLTNLHHSIF